MYSLRVEHIGTQREECEHSHRSIIIDLGELLLLISVCLHTRCGPSTEAACTSCWGSDIETRRRRGFRASQPYCSLLLPCTIWTQPAALCPHSTPQCHTQLQASSQPAPTTPLPRHPASTSNMTPRFAVVTRCPGSPSNSQLSKTLVAGGWLRLVSCAFVLPGCETDVAIGRMTTPLPSLQVQPSCSQC